MLLDVNVRKCNGYGRLASICDEVFALPCYLCAESKNDLKVKLTKKAGTSDMELRGSVVPARKSITPVVESSSSTTHTLEVASTSASQV